ncbi:MAG: histidine phosphatase family protein [Gammaproteobacteria bacterium]|nr:histidine phosphatase family protein [Gammaproteobacteria bacterium]
MAEPTVVDLIRHGQPVGGERYRGHTDDPLTEEGWAQMWRAVGEHPPWQRLVTSPLRRCRDFAHALAERLELDLEEDARFKEVHFGAWQGRLRKEVKTSEPEAWDAFYHDPVRNRPAGAEALEEFITRVHEGYRALLERHRGRHVLVVCHAGVIRTVVAQALGVPPEHLYRIVVATAGLTRVWVRDDGLPALIFHNRRCGD